jgi:hypothetical protein
VLYLTELLCQERFETHIHSPEQHSEQNLSSLAYFYMIDENVLEFNLMFIALPAAEVSLEMRFEV